jgi:hypothetical protein
LCVGADEAKAMTPEVQELRLALGLILWSFFWIRFWKLRFGDDAFVESTPTLESEGVCVMSIAKHVQGRNTLKPALQGNEDTKVACSACGRSFTAECGREAMIKLIRHLQENMADVKHRAELDWIKNELLSRRVHGRANRLAHSFQKLVRFF